MYNNTLGLWKFHKSLKLCIAVSHYVQGFWDQIHYNCKYFFDYKKYFLSVCPAPEEGTSFIKINSIFCDKKSPFCYNFLCRSTYVAYEF